MGLNSLLSVELRKVYWVRHWDVPITATLLFDYPTLNSLSTFIMQDCWGAGEPSQPVQAQGRRRECRRPVGRRCGSLVAVKVRCEHLNDGIP